MTNRRGFLLGLSAALAAPAIVRSESLMKLWVPPPPRLIFVSQVQVALGPLDKDPRWLTLGNRVAEDGVSRIIFTDHSQRGKDALMHWAKKTREVPFHPAPAIIHARGDYLESAAA